MHVKTDFKNKTCLKFLKTIFFPGKIPAFFFKKMSPDWDLIYHIMTSLYLTMLPGVLCFGYKTLENSAALLAYIWDVFESFDSSSEQEQVEEKSKSSEVVSNHK